jgi:hypothetical protein
LSNSKKAKIIKKKDIEVKVNEKMEFSSLKQSYEDLLHQKSTNITSNISEIRSPVFGRIHEGTPTRKITEKRIQRKLRTIAEMPLNTIDILRLKNSQNFINLKNGKSERRASKDHSFSGRNLSTTR